LLPPCRDAAWAPLAEALKANEEAITKELIDIQVWST
jgi:hypothetical protein